MVILAWLGVPVLATLVAVGWTQWASRPARPHGMHQSVAEYERFRQALSATTRRQP
jgi:hypothetical protein